MDWSHPNIADPKCAIHDTDDIAAEARSALSRRRTSYPDLVKNGRIPADEARADLEAWRAIAKDWHWIAFGEGQPVSADTLGNRIVALDTAIARWLDMASQSGNRMSHEDGLQGAVLCAMRWWAERERPSLSHCRHIREIAELGHHWRREHGHPTRGELLAAQRQAKAIRNCLSAYQEREREAA